MHRHAVHHAAHAVLADAEVDLAAAGLVPGQHALALDRGAGVAGEVGAAADEAGHLRAGAPRGTRRSPCGWRPSRPRPRSGGRRPSRAGPCRRGTRPTRRGGPVHSSSRFSHASRAPRPARPGAPVEGEHVVGHVEGLVGREAEDLLGDADLVLAERVAVGVARCRCTSGTGSRCGCAGSSSDGASSIVHRPPQAGLEGVEVVGDLAEVARRASRRPRTACPRRRTARARWGRRWRCGCRRRRRRAGRGRGGRPARRPRG